MSAPTRSPEAAAAVDLAVPPSLERGLFLTAALGGAVFLLGTFVDPERAWGGYLMAFTYFTGLALCGPLFLAVLYLTRARWGLPLVRIPEAMAAALPAAFVLGLVLITGTHVLYEWSHSQAVEVDPLLSHKAPWLNVYGFSLRLVLYFAVWIWTSRKLVARSRSSVPEPQRTRRTIALSALFMAAFAVTFSLASIDWIQSLDPHWFSTIFALRTLSGIGCAGVATCILVVVTLRRRGLMRDVVTKDVLDDLGKILLGLTLMWAYVWYCEYMIIWYTNLPEETGYFLLRREGSWGLVAPVNLALGFAGPFLALMLRAWRRNGVILARIAGCVLLGHALDLFIMVAPPVMHGELRYGLWELGPLAGALALFAWILVRRLATGASVRG